MVLAEVALLPDLTIPDFRKIKAKNSALPCVLSTGAIRGSMKSTRA
jgi:hypothetical protein